jgi:hypothetical protein
MASTEAGRLLAYNIYICKKPDMDAAAHHDHVMRVNTPIIIPLLRKYGATSYTVVSLSNVRRKQSC